LLFYDIFNISHIPMLMSWSILNIPSCNLFNKISSFLFSNFSLSEFFMLWRCSNIIFITFINNINLIKPFLFLFCLHFIKISLTDKFLIIINLQWIIPIFILTLINFFHYKFLFFLSLCLWSMNCLTIPLEFYLKNFLIWWFL
jgi:hypothetical protein